MALANPVPTEQLATYFTQNNIEYFTVPSYVGYGGTGDYLFVPTRDPLDHETLGVFFELRTYNSLNDSDAHWAVGLRGPRPGGPLDHYAGRGLALGKFGSPQFAPCNGNGAFIEDFTANELGGEPALTTCQPVWLANQSTYRIDVHVSKLNVYTVVWKKTPLPYGIYTYTKVAEHSCSVHDGPSGRTGHCPEALDDAPYGGFFIGSAFLDGGAGYIWTASRIHVAFF